MSRPLANMYRRRASLTGIDLSSLPPEALRALVRQIIEAGIHGISFSPYMDGQTPGVHLLESQIRERLSLIAPYVSSIRTFSCTDGHELIPAIAAELGVQTLMGVWLGDDLQQNEMEMANAIEVARSGSVKLVGVGNEVLLRGDLTDTQLADYLRRFKQAVPDVSVGYADAYFEFSDHPLVTDACDVLLANCYPFWEGFPAEHALVYMKEMYRRAVAAGGGKKVVISETGWPNKGEPEEHALPSRDNAVKYFIDTYRWAEEEGIEIFYFSAFDEDWKIAAEGEVGAYWGLWDKNGQPKYF